MKSVAKLRTFVSDSDWDVSAKKNPKLKPYWTVRHELTVQDGLLLFGTRIVIPQSLQREMFERIHEGHKGIVKCRALARQSIWWPRLSSEIEKESC